MELIFLLSNLEMQGMQFETAQVLIVDMYEFSLYYIIIYNIAISLLWKLRFQIKEN
jgi:hypothetical protein